MADASTAALRRRRAADTKQTTHNITNSTTSGSASPVGTSRRASAVSAPAAVVTSARTGTVHVDPPTRHRTAAAAAPFVLPPSPKPQSAHDAAAERRAEIERQQRKRAPPGVYEQLDDVPRHVAARASLSLPAKPVATPTTSNTTTSSGGSTATHPHSISVTAPTTHSTNAPSREVPERSRAAQPRQPASPAASRTFLVNADVDQDADPAAAARGPTKEQLAHIAADVQQQLGQPRYVAMTARQAAAEEHWRESHNYAQLVRGLHERLGIVPPQPAQPTLSPRSEARRLALPKPMHVVADVTDKVVALRRAEMAEMTARVRRMLAEAAIVGVPVIPLVSVESSGVPCPACQYCIELTSEATIRAYLVPVLQTVVSERVVVPMAGRRGSISVLSSAVSESAETIDAFPVHQSSRAPSTADPGPARYSVPRSFRVEVVPFGLHKVSVHVSVHTSLVEHFYRAHAREQEHSLSLAIDPPFPEEWAAWTDADRQRLLHRVLDERLHAGANPIVPVAEKTVVMYPAHVDAMRDALWATAWSARSLMGWLTIPEDAVAGYLGPEVMFYYAWMNHYARWLLGAGLLGVLVSLLGSLRLAPDAAAAAVVAAPLDSAAWTADGAPVLVLVPAVSHVMRLRRAVQHGLDVALLPGFSATMLVGSVLCIKMWERRCSALSMKYRLFQQEGKDEPRHDFRGTPGTDPVTGEPQLTYPAWYRAMVLQPLAWAVVTLFMAGTLGLMVCSLNLDGMVSDPASHLAIPVLRRLTEDGRLLDQSVHPVAAMLPQLGYSVLIAALSFIFTALAKFLTRLENYRYRGEYVRALTLKRVAFEFVNSYAKLFFVAFGRGSMTELASNLQSILYVAVLSRLMSDTVVPFVMTHRRRVMRRLFRATSASTTSSPTAGSGSTRAPREVGHVNVHGGSSASPLDEVDEMLDPYDIYMDSIEMMIQFGYLLLFAAAYPLASFVALLSNIIEVRSDLFKMCYVVRRPVPRLGVQQNATWCGVMRGFAMAAVITNTFLLAFTSHQMERWFPDYFAAPRGAGDKTTAASMAATLNRSLRLDAAGLEMVPGKGRYVVLYSMVMEHVMGLIAVFLFWRIPSTPRDVRHYQSRKMFERMSRA